MGRNRQVMTNKLRVVETKPDKRKTKKKEKISKNLMTTWEEESDSVLYKHKRRYEMRPKKARKNILIIKRMGTHGMKPEKKQKIF